MNLNPAALEPRTDSALPHNLILFGRVLRGLGLDVNPGRMIDAASALSHVSIGNRADFYHTLRSLLVHKRDDVALFDQAFDEFWKKPLMGALVTLPKQEIVQREKKNIVVPPQPEREAPSVAPGDESGAQTVIELTRTPDAREQLRNKNFADMSAQELESIKRLIAQMVWRLGERRTRRMRAGDERAIDLRHTLRNSLRHGGEILRLERRQRRRKPRPIVIVADISGSMERYTKLLLHFIYSLTAGLDQRVESFVFATRLTRITRSLEHRDAEQALARVSGSVRDWSGGTKIGASIKSFNHLWGRRVLNGGAVVLLISDGWDTGEPEVLAAQMARLHGTCARVIWLNPLLGDKEYAPLARGMQAAMPHIDDFLPVHNLASLEALAERLGNLSS